jgi:mannose-6-phosphate isomerase-like protein (cupin superfamily)
MRHRPTTTQTRTVPYVLAPGEMRGNPRSMPGVKAGSADTGGALAIFEDALEPWTPGPPLHLHTREDEALYVLEGRLLVQVGEQRHELDAGSFAWIPRDTPHTFAAAGPARTRLLGWVVPGGLEGLFLEQGEYLSRLHAVPDPAELERIGARYGSRLLGAPIVAPR